MTTEELAVKVTDIDARSRSNMHRIDEVEKKQDDLGKLVTSVALLANKQENIESDVGEIKSDVKQLMDKPGKRWDGLVEKIIWAIAAAALTYVLARIGLGG